MARLIAWVLVAVPVGDAVATAILWRAARANPELVTLRERAIASAILWLAASFGAVLGLAYLLGVKLPSPASLALLLGPLLLLSLPAYIWLALYWRSR